MAWHKKLHWRIIIGLALGVGYGVLAASMGWGQFTDDWITPFGTVFLNALKLIGVPLVLGSLITGVASLSDVRKVSRIGSRTIIIYVTTTAVAVTIGLLAVNLVRPGDRVPDAVKAELQQAYSGDAEQRETAAQATRERGPLDMFVDMIPDNFFSSASNNRNMLQVVIIVIFVGIGLIQLPENKAKPLIDVFESLSGVVIRSLSRAPRSACSPIGSTKRSRCSSSPAIPWSSTPMGSMRPTTASTRSLVMSVFAPHSPSLPTGRRPAWRRA